MNIDIYGHYGSGSRVYDSDLLIFAGRGKKAAVPTPVHRLYGLTVASDYANGLGLLQIPQNHLIVSARADHDILGGRMPLYLAYFTLMTVQIDDPLVQILE